MPTDACHLPPPTLFDVAPPAPPPIISIANALRPVQSALPHSLTHSPRSLAPSLPRSLAPSLPPVASAGQRAAREEGRKEEREEERKRSTRALLLPLIASPTGSLTLSPHTPPDTRQHGRAQRARGRGAAEKEGWRG
eukprot:2657374-Rhodomonas_salina.1